MKRDIIYIRSSVKFVYFHSQTVSAASRALLLSNAFLFLEKIIVLHQGEIIEHGSFDTLLAQNGRFTELWKHQNK